MQHSELESKVETLQTSGIHIALLVVSQYMAEIYQKIGLYHGSGLTRHAYRGMNDNILVKTQNFARKLKR